MTIKVEIPPECKTVLTLGPSLTADESISIVREYKPTIEYGDKTFRGPHDFAYCVGTYTQTIEVVEQVKNEGLSTVGVSSLSVSDKATLSNFSVKITGSFISDYHNTT